MITGTFFERIAELRRRTSLGKLLHGQVIVDQVYAHYQHEHLEFRHPRGGQALYLTTPLMLHYPSYLAEIAHDWLNDGGQRGMEHAMEHLAGEVERYAPWEFVDLARSGSPRVDVGGVTRYERPPKQHRLTPAELRAKSRLLYPMLPDRLKGWIWWHVQHHTTPPPRRHG